MIIKSEVTTILNVLLFVVVSGFWPAVGAKNAADTQETRPAGYTKEGTILVFGDSISAAYGMDQQQGWVHLLSKRLSQEDFAYQVVNASVSGETTGGGLIRLPKSLEIHQPDIVILELGGNDGLRGYPIDRIRDNLARMIELSRQARADVLLIGMVLPPNYGRRYTDAFESLYRELADRYDVTFLPKLLEGTDTERQLIQRDGIHPTPDAQHLILEDVWPHLRKQLRSGTEEARYSPNHHQ